MAKSCTCIFLIIFMPVISVAETVTIPFGTTIYCELDEDLSSKKKDGAAEGDLVRVRVWKDVWIDDRLIIEAGTPVYARISRIRKAKMAGRKGILEIETLNVTSVDGRDVPLDGGYDKSGKGKMGLSIALAAVVAWPLIFLKGKNAFLKRGTVFDAIVRSAVDVNVSAEAPARTLSVSPPLKVSVLYDEMDPDSKIKDLPLQLQAQDAEVESARIISVNGEKIAPIPIRLAGASGEGVRGLVDFKLLSKNFDSGMNRFDVEAAGETAEVLLEIEF